MGVVRVEIPVDEAAACGLADPKRLQAVGRPVSRMLRPTRDRNLLPALLDTAGRAAEPAGLTQEDIEPELAARNGTMRRAEWAISFTTSRSRAPPLPPCTAIG